MSENYTAADVKVASRAIARKNMPNASEKLIDHLVELGEWDDAARWVLDAVAPAIAARALREAAAVIERTAAGPKYEPGWRTAAAGLHARADEIEATS